MTIFDLQLLPAGRVELHDARRQSRRTAEIELFEICAVPIAEAQYAGSTETEALGERLPATEMSWLDAIQFCNAASRREELP
ncbi:MAG: formylglycine-generating enzyme family protein, partial [Arthrobacter sp.]|nr:formylglycine-generating enzyme family protein [Arthrobacter sp.]